MRRRKETGGDKAAGHKKTLEKLVEAHTKRNPMKLLLWTSKSIRSLSAGLSACGYTASHVLVSTMLKETGYTLQADGKGIMVSSQRPGRNAQFEYINEQAR
ncbi:MAG: hypothetical protein LBH43_18235 [Treponema sp.]|nr:hypothetical protein [Treponema sp.]